MPHESFILEDDIFVLTSSARREMDGAETSLSASELQVLALVDRDTTAGDISTRATGIAHDAVVDILRKLHHDGLIEILKGAGGRLDFVDSFETKYIGKKPPDIRRVSKRYQARWKVALAHAKATNRPVFYSYSHDLSLSGISVYSQTDEEINSTLTLMMAPPTIAGDFNKILKLKALVKSSRSFGGAFAWAWPLFPTVNIKIFRASSRSSIFLPIAFLRNRISFARNCIHRFQD